MAMGDAQLRHLVNQPATAEPLRRGRNVLAVIGIDNYKHLQRLHNGVSDAKGVRTLFVQDLGFQELAPPLYDEQATREAITALVLDQLNSLLEPEDSLLFFFAGHGYTETRQVGARNVQTGYLIPVEGSRPEDRKFSSYLRLDAFLEDVANLPARHILVILDACYSGFALGETVQRLRSPQRFSEDLSRRMSRRVITSAMNDQPALDSGPVPGHSLFTGALVEALALGKADDEHKGFVTSSELALYLQRQVASWPGSQQTPDFGDFALDERGELVISLVGETQNRQLAEESLQIATHSYRLGQLTGDPQQFRFAADQYQEARKHALLGKWDLPAAHIGLGQALLASGDEAAATKVLTELVAERGAQAPPATYFYLGLAHAQALDYMAAAQALQQWRTLNPAHEDGAWVEAYGAWLNRVATHQTGRRRALLIGIDHYQLPKAFDLPGCINDVQRLIQPLLRQRFGFQPDDILLLTDETATRQGVLDAFATLQQHSTLDDIVLIHFSGHSIPSSAPLYFGDNAQEVYWILHDTQEAGGQLTNGLSALELHQLVKAIPAAQKTLILDTHGNRALIDLAESAGDYHLILASDTAEIAYEWHIEQAGESLPCGLLSGALYQALVDRATLPALTYDEWVNRATEIAQTASSQPEFAKVQTPLFVGARAQIVFSLADPYLTFFAFAERRGWASYTTDQLTRLYTHFQTVISAPFPQVDVAFGRAFLAQSAYQQALDAFQRALDQGAHLPQDGATPAGVQEIYALLKKLTAITRHVVIFLRDSKKSKVTTPATGGEFAPVPQQILELQALLRRKYGANGYRLEIIYQEKAQEQQILTKLKRLAKRAPQEPALVCIIGGAHRATGESAAEPFLTQCRQLIAGKAIFLWLQQTLRP